MKYQPVNLNFIPKDERLDRDLVNAMPVEEVEMELETSVEDLPAKDTRKQKEVLHPRREVFTLEEKIILNNQIEHLKEQLNYSEDQVSALQMRLHESNNKITALKDQLNSYEAYRDDLDQVTSLNINLSRLSNENEELKQQLKQQKDHVQMLYLILLILAIL